MRIHRTLPGALTIATAAILIGCGGGGGGASDGTTATDAQVKELLDSSNIAVGNLGGTWRWSGSPAQVSVYLEPPLADSAEQADAADKAREAIAATNRRLAGLLVMTAVDAPPFGGDYIHVSYGTAYVPPGATNFQNYCANVATAQNTGTPISPAPDGTVASQPVYVNLGNGRCNLSQEIVTHEFGHALGLGGHFDGFGMGDAISPAYWDVLATLYANPLLTARDSLSVRRAED